MQGAVASAALCSGLSAMVTGARVGLNTGCWTHRRQGSALCGGATEAFTRSPVLAQGFSQA